MTDKTFTNVSKMIRDITNDDSVIAAVDEALERQAILRQLMSLRAARGLSQSHVAKAMGCAQSTVSKMESSGDADVQFGDLQRYAGAVRGDLCTAVRPLDMEPSMEVKCLAATVNDKLKRMADLANQDEEIAAGVAQVYVEALVNFNLIIAQAIQALPKNADGTPRIHINLTLEESSEADAEDSDGKGSAKRATVKRKRVTGPSC